MEEFHTAPVPQFSESSKQNVFKRTVFGIEKPRYSISISFLRRLTVKKSAVLLAVLASLSVSTLAQAQTATSSEANQTSTYRVSVVSRTTPAVQIRAPQRCHQDQFPWYGFDAPGFGRSKGQSNRGAMAIQAEFAGLDKPSAFGGEYLTYVLWAISPEGRSVNLGEVLVGNNDRSKLNVTTDLQAFALIVTAEPYYAVRRPSNVVVLENEVRPDTAGTTEAVNAKYELMDRGGYIPTGYAFDPVVLNSKLPLEFFEARNAVRIAKLDGAEQNASSSYENAVTQMKHADDLGTMKHVDKKSLISVSREVVQTADDAREIAVKRIDADRVSADRNAERIEWPNADAKSQKAMQDRMNAESGNRRCGSSPCGGGQGRRGRHGKKNSMPSRNPTGIALRQQKPMRPRITPIRPRQTLSRLKETPRRNRNVTKQRRQTPINNSSKRRAIVKNFAPNCCSNSTPFSPLAIPHAVLW